MKRSQKTPRKRKDAEIVIKFNYGIRTVSSDGDVDLSTGLAVFANRRGYRFLSDFFAHLAERPAEKRYSQDKQNFDPGRHEHLDPDTKFSDDIFFTFDTVDTNNRRKLYRDAGISKASRKNGSPLKIFRELAAEMVKFAKNSRFSTVYAPLEHDIDNLIATLGALKHDIAAFRNSR